jgi:TniQ
MSEDILSVSPLRLLRTPAPYSGESFLGYLLRLNEENAYDSLCWIPELVGLKVNLAEVRSLETLSTGPMISLLREITGLNETELESLRKTLVPGYLLRWKAPKVCSVCLKEKSWCRKAWDVLPFTVCPLHRAILIDYCPHCYQSLSWRRKNVSVCRCGYDWRRISPLVIEGDGELTAVRRMLSIWRENEPGYFPLEDATDSPLTQEVSTVYPDALCALSDAWLFLRNEARLQATTENGLCHRAVTSIASALDDWPERFFRFCDEFDTAALQNLRRLWFGYSG